MGKEYLEGMIRQYEYYKVLAEKSFEQVNDEALYWQYNDASNSIAIIVKHLWGNMLSRWTDFLTSDGEKEWRDRDAEFVNDLSSRAALMHKWNEGWDCVFQALRGLTEDDLNKMIYIRNLGQTVADALNRQLAHYAYHVGQIVFIARMQAHEWTSLSIPKGQSKTFNQEKFSQPKHKEHFTDEFLSKNKDEA